MTFLFQTHSTAVTSTKIAKYTGLSVRPFTPTLLTSALILALSLALSGCGNDDSSNTAVQPENPTPENPEPETPNPPDVDTDWQAAGGIATIPSNSLRPFLQLIPSLPATALQGVSQGRELFITQWTPAGEGRALFDGVGPLFNATACTQCHSSEGRMPTYGPNGQLNDAILFRLGNKQGSEHPFYGGQMQHQSIDAAIATEGLMTYAATSAQNGYPAGVLFNFTPTDLNQPLNNGSSQFHVSGRISPQLVGMGLLDLIPEASIVASADEDDANQDGISGRVHWVFDDTTKRVGRFGWKAINSSLRSQNANAMSQDMGLTTSLFIDPNCTANQPICWSSANGGSPEVSNISLDAVTDFMTALAVPERRIDDLNRFNQGANLFSQVGCASCHTPQQVTGTSQRFPLLSQQTIYPYTDLLLHDMGAGLDDGVKEKGAESYEWRTPPLWGIGLVTQDPDARFLHDGRATTLKDAVLWHGGEAQKVKERFIGLEQSQQEKLLDFVKGL